MRSCPCLAAIPALVCLSSFASATQALPRWLAQRAAEDTVAYRLAQLFLPRFEFAKKPVDAWLAQLEQGEGENAIDALWCVYWTNDRSAKVVSRLKAAYSSASEMLASEIDVVLTQWGVAHEAPPAYWPPELQGGAMAATELDAQLARRTGIDSRSIAVLCGDSAGHLSGATEVYLAPSGAFSTAVRVRELSPDDLERALHSADRVEQAEAAATIAFRRGDVRAVLAVLNEREAADPDARPRSMPLPWISFGYADQPDSFRRCHEVAFGSGHGWACRGSASRTWPVEETTRATISWIESFAGTARYPPGDAKSVATSAGSKSRRTDDYQVKERSVDDLAGDASPATRASRLLDRLETCLARHADTEQALSELLSFLEPAYDEDGAVGGIDRYFGFLWWLDSHAFTDPRVTEWCLSIVASEWPFATHLQSATNYLSRQRLDRRQQAILCRFDERIVSFGTNGSLDFEPAAFANQGDAAIELAGYLRFQAQRRQDLQLLDAVLAIAKPSPRDHEMLVAAATRGVASERLHAIQIVGARGLDTPAIRAAVRSATEDVDRFVRDAAAAQVRDRRW